MNAVKAVKALKTVATSTMLIASLMLLWICCAKQSFAQDALPSAEIQRTGFTVVDTIRISHIRFGGYVHGVVQQHSINAGGFAAPLDNTALLGSFALTGGTLSGEGGVLGEFPLVGGLGIAARLGAMLFAPQFAYTVPTSVGALDTPAQYIITASTNVIAFTIEPMLSYRLLDRLQVYAGATLAMPLVKTFSQSRSLALLEPSSDPLTSAAAETARSRIQSSQTGTLQSTFIPMASVGASWEFALDKYGKTLLAPELFYSFALGNVATGLFAPEGSSLGSAAWRMNALRVGASLRFAPERTVRLLAEELDTQYQRYDDSVRAAEQAKKRALEAALKNAVQAEWADIVGINRDGSVLPNPSVKVEEFLASTSRHLVNVVFFAEGSAELPSRYRRLRSAERARFTVENLVEETTMQTYYHIVNIVGKRLSNTPQAKLTLIGYNDAMGEKTDKTLGLRRAEMVKAYLVEVWGIEAKRITTKSGGTRQQQLTDALDAEESRCVELQATLPSILEELRFDYALRVIEPPVIRITPKLFAGAGIKQWDVEATQIVGQESRTLKSATGTSAEAVITMDMQNARESEQPASEEPITLQLSATDTKGRDAKAPVASIPVEMVSVEKKRKAGKRDERVDTYLVFAFNLGTNIPMAENAAVQRVANAIATTLKTGATVDITGYTDTRGKPEANQALSEERARAVAKLINFPAAKAQGKGSTMLHDNTTPEGRFYNRFVQVDVRTPLR